MSIVMPKIAPNAQVSREKNWVPRALVVGWRWWVAELNSVFAPLVNKYWIDQAHIVAVSLDAEGAPPPLMSVNGRDVKVLLPDSLVLQKLVTYPAAIEENLVEVLTNDIDRQTPFTSDQVYFGGRIARRHEGLDGVTRIDIALSLVQRRIADKAMEAIRRNGGRVTSLALVGESQAIELLPESARPAKRLSRLQKINLALLLLLAMLMIMAISVPIIMKRNDVKLLTPLVEKARNEAEATRKIETEFQRLYQEYQYAMGKKYAAYPAVDIVEELSKLSPDTTWLQNFEMKLAPQSAKNVAGKTPIREIQIIGEAASASKMIELIEQSKLMQNTTQRAQTTRGALPNTEKFQIATEVKPRAAPELVDLIALADKPAATTAPAVSPAAIPPSASTGVATVLPTPPIVPTAPTLPSAVNGPDKNAKDGSKEPPKDAQKDLPKSMKPSPAPTAPPTTLTKPMVKA